MSGKTTVAANAARAQQRLRRIEDYRRLTRDAAVPAKVARQKVGIALGTALAYEREITGMSGLERFQARVDQYAALLQQGLTRTQACARLGVTNRTGYNYERALARTQTPGVTTPGATGTAPGPVALPGRRTAPLPPGQAPHADGPSWGEGPSATLRGPGSPRSAPSPGLVGPGEGARTQAVTP